MLQQNRSHHLVCLVMEIQKKMMVCRFEKLGDHTFFHHLRHFLQLSTCKLAPTSLQFTYNCLDVQMHHNTTIMILIKHGYASNTIHTNGGSASFLQSSKHEEKNECTYMYIPMTNTMYTRMNTLIGFSITRLYNAAIYCVLQYEY